MKLTWFTEHYQLNLQLESLHVEINQMVLPLRKPSTVYDIQIHQINLLQNLSKWGSSLVDFKLDKLQTNKYVYIQPFRNISIGQDPQNKKYHRMCSKDDYFKMNKSIIKNITFI